MARAEDLAGIPDVSVDVVTTRSVLIYVAEKARAFSAMHRVLRPGGRISLFEPINRLMFPEPDDRFFGYQMGGAIELAAKVKAVFAQSADRSAVQAMMGFDDRDLAGFAQAAGFERVHVECHINLEPGSVMGSVSLQALLNGTPNPHAPTVREAIASALTEPEQRQFTAELERAFADRKPVRRMAAAYLVAQKSL